ncbi:MAG: alkaline phosphatase D family protein [Proteobacteria bacterium]|nr:alkaline phosphatase D family protein [Pseudomonadota bacterium]
MSQDDSLPLLLCGPQVRRVDKNRCFIWIATSRRCSAEVVIFPSGTDDVRGRSTPASTDVVRLGKNFFVYLFRIEPDEADSFEVDKLLEYDVMIEDRSLSDMGYSNLALPGFKRPSFFIPSQGKSLLVGSCRKPHGSAQSSAGAMSSDALSYAWTLLEKSAHDMDQRPSALLLLGDQIYADDVAGPLLESLKVTARTLFEDDEEIPGIGSVSAIGYGTRWEVAYRIGFTTGEGAHHLLAFSEFVAMYLAVYGGYRSPVPVRAPALNGAAQTATDTLEGEDERNLRARVEAFLEACQHVRCLLANIPTYAIFDDHEVTDDWYIDRRARENVEKVAGARRVVVNALCAYWAFQGWGNDPDSFNHEFFGAIEDGIQAVDRRADAGRKLEEMLISCQRWHFVTSTEPPVIFLDTRTQRSYAGALGLGHLAGPLSLDWLWAEAKKIKSTHKYLPIYIAAVTPVLGYMPLEFLQGALSRLLKRVLEIADIDHESWIAEREGYFALIRMLMDAGVSDCIFLGGDVHYGFAKKGIFEHRSEKCRLMQVVSSPLNNESAGSIRLKYLDSIVGHRRERRVGYLGRQFRNRIRRILRPWIIDPAVFNGLHRPDTSNGEAWYDEASLISIEGHDEILMNRGHIAILWLKDGEPDRVEFRYRGENEVAMSRLR